MKGNKNWLGWNRKSTRKIVLLSCLVSIILCLFIGSISLSNISLGEPNSLPYIISRESTINVKIIIDSTFDSTIDFEGLLTDYETLYSSKSRLPYKGKYSLNLEYQYLTIQEHSDFTTYLESTQIQGEPNGYEINSSRTIMESEDLLMEKTGEAFNATDTLLWLADHLWDQKWNEYSLFLFNLTDIDTMSGLPHWWLYYPIDIDTNSPPLEIAQIVGINQEVPLKYGRQVPAWGGWKFPIHFIDLSSKFWIGSLLSMINESPFSWNWPSSSYHHLTHTFSDFGTPVNVSDLNFLMWIESWLNDFILGIYRDSVMGYHYNIAESVYIPNLVINNWSTTPSWLIHDNLIEMELSRAFPWMTFEVETRWKTFSDFPELESKVNKSINYNTSDSKPELEISTSLPSFCRDFLFPFEYNYSAADLISPSLIFLLNNMSLSYNGDRVVGYSYDWGGQILGIESPAAYLNDGVTPDRGLSALILHEVGHTLGLRHPYDGSTPQNIYELGFASMFTHTLMTFFHDVSEFSVYDINALGHATSDFYLAPAEWYASEMELISEVNSSIKFENALEILHQAQDAQEQWNYTSSISLAKEALTILEELYESATTADSTTNASNSFLLLLLSLGIYGYLLRRPGRQL